jgi:hypothetical protein
MVRCCAACRPRSLAAGRAEQSKAGAELGEVVLRLCDEYVDSVIGSVGEFGEATLRLAATG